METNSRPSSATGESSDLEPVMEGGRAGIFTCFNGLPCGKENSIMLDT